MIEELTKIAEQMNELLPRFVETRTMGLVLRTEDSARFKALAIEAKAILDEELGRLNEYSTGLLPATNSGENTAFGDASYALVEEASQIVLAGVRAVVRKRTRPAEVPKTKSYVDPSRIGALQAIGGGKWDFARLVELCREINITSANRCHMSTAMLLRTILNHVPPALGFRTFDEVANNYGGEKKDKSFKGAMQRLEGSLRNIADMHLHSPIRDREVVPTAVQVDFAAELDVLLGEVIRVCR